HSGIALPPFSLRARRSPKPEPSSGDRRRMNMERRKALRPWVASMPLQRKEGKESGALVGAPRCLVSQSTGLWYEPLSEEDPWLKFFTNAPRQRTPSEQRYSDRKIRSRR